MEKRITLVQRQASVERAEFPQIWRKDVMAHIANIPKAERPRRVEHCLVRQGRKSALCDGIELAWFDDTAADTSYENWLHDRLGVSVVGQRIRVIESVRVEERCVYGAEWLTARRDRASPPPGCLLLGFIQRASGLSRTEFRDYWWDKHRPLANELVPPAFCPSAYVHDYVLSDEESRWDGFGEMYETDLERARQRGVWFQSPDAKPLEVDEENFMARETRTVLITDHNILL